MADVPFKWEPPAPKGGPSWLARQPKAIRLPMIACIWAVAMVLVALFVLPLIGSAFSGFGRDEPAPARPSGQVEQRAGVRPAPEYDGPRPCATVWPPTCDDGGR